MTCDSDFSSSNSEPDRSLSEDLVSDKECKYYSSSSSSSSDSSSDSEFDVEDIELEPEGEETQTQAVLCKEKVEFFFDVGRLHAHAEGQKAAQKCEQRSCKSRALGPYPGFAFMPSARQLSTIEEDSQLWADTSRNPCRKSSGALQVQTAWRGWRCRHKFKAIRIAILKLQTHSRVVAARKLARKRREEVAVAGAKLETHSRLHRIRCCLEQSKVQMDAIDFMSVDLNNGDVCRAIRQMEEMGCKLLEDSAIVDLGVRSSLDRTPRHPALLRFSDSKSLQVHAQSNNMVPASTSWDPRWRRRSENHQPHEGDSYTDDEVMVEYEHAGRGDIIDIDAFVEAEDSSLERRPCYFPWHMAEDLRSDPTSRLSEVRAAPAKIRQERRAQQVAASEQLWLSSLMGWICEDEGRGCAPERTLNEDDLVIEEQTEDSTVYHDSLNAWAQQFFSRV